MSLIEEDSSPSIMKNSNEVINNIKGLFRYTYAEFIIITSGMITCNAVEATKSYKLEVLMATSLTSYHLKILTVFVN
jgi:hypothetical protein